MVEEMRRRLLLCVLPVLLAVPAILATAAATATRTADAQRETALEQGILREVNRLRAARGLRTLVLSPALQSAAVYQSRDMLDRGYFDHDVAGGTPFDERLRRFYPVLGGSSWLVGENLLWSSAGISPVAAVKMWSASPPHRRIVFDPSWREIGLGAFSVPLGTGPYAVADGPVVVVTMDVGSRGAERTTASSSGLRGA